MIDLLPRFLRVLFILGTQIAPYLTGRISPVEPGEGGPLEVSVASLLVDVAVKSSTHALYTSSL